jgi:hypothetical protein
MARELSLDRFDGATLYPAKKRKILSWQKMKNSQFVLRVTYFMEYGLSSML